MFLRKFSGGNDRYKKTLFFCFVGMIINLFLGSIKIFIGYESGFLSVVGDGFNNITDVGAVVLLAMAIYYATQPADAAHPFGYGRLEYISSTVISSIIIYVGMTLLVESITKIRFPTDTEFTAITAGVLLFSIIVKCFLAWLYGKVGKSLNSESFQAYGKDSLSDVFATTGILVATFVEFITGYHIDGIVGVIVSLLILYTGYEILKKALNRIVGTTVDLDLYKQIKQYVLKVPGVYGIHDLIIHDYGPEHHFASLHIEVDSRITFLQSHDITEEVTDRLRDKFNLQVVVHADPFAVADPREKEYRRDLESAIYQSRLPVTYHNFFATTKKNRIHLSFELTIESHCEKTDEEIYRLISEKITKINPLYQVELLVDRNFISGKLYGK